MEGGVQYSWEKEGFRERQVKIVIAPFTCDPQWQSRFFLHYGSLSGPWCGRPGILRVHGTGLSRARRPPTQGFRPLFWTISPTARRKHMVLLFMKGFFWTSEALPK